MIGLDTNILIRYVTQDDPTQAAKVSRIIDSASSGSLFISNVVVCEVVWVLEDGYDQSKAQIADLLEKILLIHQFSFEEKDLIWQALADFRRGKAGLADYVIGRIAQHAGCEHTLTFDRGLRQSEQFNVL